MNKDKKWFYLLLACVAFLLGRVLMFILYGGVRNFDKEHLLFLYPIVGPLIGAVIGFLGIVKTDKYMKVLCLFAMLANLGLAVVIFLSYSFSYWQF